MNLPSILLDTALVQAYICLMGSATAPFCLLFCPFVVHLSYHCDIANMFSYLVTKTHLSNPHLLFNHLSLSTKSFIAWLLVPPDSSLFLHLSLHLLLETGLQDSFLCGSDI